MILDPFGGQVGEKFTALLSKWKGAMFVTLAPPVLSKTDDLGAGLGLISAGQSLTSSALQKVRVVQHSNIMRFLPHFVVVTKCPLNAYHNENPYPTVVEHLVMPMQTTPNLIMHLYWTCMQKIQLERLVFVRLLVGKETTPPIDS